MVGGSNSETRFPYKLLLDDAQYSRTRQAFPNTSSATIKFSLSQLSKMVQSGEFLGRVLGPLLKTGLLYLEMYLNFKPSGFLIPPHPTTNFEIENYNQKRG